MTEPGQSQAVAPQLITTPALPPMYFSVSTLKLVVMSICTFGIYELYWFCANWTSIKEHEKLDINPIGRTIFSHFFCYSLFKRIQSSAEQQQAQTFISPALLAIGWILFTLLGRLPEPFWLASFFAVLFLVPVQNLVNKLNLIAYPGIDPNAKFTKWNIVGVVLGGLLFILMLVGLLLPPS